MEQIKTVSDVIALWPATSNVSLAADVGVKRQVVQRWGGNNQIPAKYFASVLRAAAKRKLGLKPKVLIAIHDCRA